MRSEMGLISNMVEIPISNRNKGYYERLGYTIPAGSRWDKKSILVDIKDVQKHSQVKLDLICDGCGKHISFSISDYNRRNHNSKTYCNLCAHRILNSGENNNKWNPNLTDEDRKERRLDIRYVEFRKRVLARDNYICQCCSQTGKMEVHHLNGFKWDKDGRYDVKNGITLCPNCHKNFHTIYGKENNTKKQFEEWIGKIIDCSEFEGIILPSKKVICLDNNEIYRDAKTAARANNTLSSIISRACLGKKNIKYGQSTKSVNGLHFLYLDEYEKMSEKEIKDYWDWVNESKTFKTEDGRHSSCKKLFV